MVMFQLIDFVTKKLVKPQGFVFAGDDTPWEIQMDLDLVKTKVNLDYFKIAPPCLSKYLSLMPIGKISEFISLRETATPLIKSKVLGNRLGLDLYFKVEAKNPTGSFKDRGSAVDISVARELGAKAIILASTGNMAASCACYAAAAKMPCFVLVPEGVSVSKLAQVIAFGGHIIQIKGNYNDAATLAKTIAEERGFYLAGDYAYRVEGQKTAAFEMLEQLLFQPPDLVVVPIGCGTNITAYAKGLFEYHQLGLIDTIPKLMGVQAQNACAVVNSFNQKRRTVDPLASADTLASAIAVPYPIDGIKALDAIYKTQGSAVAVTDQEILQAQHLLSTEEGLFVESASAATIAALVKVVQKPAYSNLKIVCVLTGDGLKDANVVLRAAIKPPTIYPDKKEFSLLYENNFFDGKSMIFIDENQILFHEEPSINQIKEQLAILLNANYSQDYLVKIKSILGRILQKGKVITVSDFQDSVQDALEAIRYKANEIFSVLDFEVTTGKDRAARANVTINIAGDRRQAEAQGVGPVDAICNALRHACKEQMDFLLTDYKVDIRSQGVDAVVYVELKLVKNHFHSLGRGTSPDIIQASIEAFEEAYNGFYGENHD
jgi:threonine synthase